MIIEKQTSGEQMAVRPEEGTMALLPLLFGKHVTFCLSAVARLGVPDHMSLSESVRVGDLARKVGADESSLYRVLRMLATTGAFEETESRCFRLTPVSYLLRSDAPGTMRHFAMQVGDPWAVRSFEHMTETLCTGEDGVTKAYGENIFEYFRHQPEEAQTFNRSMTSFSDFVSEAVLKAYDFSGIRRMADVGGGHGALLASILKQYPGMQGVVFDLANVVASADGSPHLQGCANRIAFEQGSFFETVPAGCDAYILKFILHDWNDAACRTILSLIRAQMLTMTPGGKERTAQEFDDLFASVGLRLMRIVETGSPVRVLEARRAD
jgi:hypothetical protein